MWKLVIGNKNYSSWSLRAWLHLRRSGVAFEEKRVALFDGPDWRDALAPYTPAGRVPVLIDGDRSIWDSLAIMEYVLERHDGAVGWPEDEHARAIARSVAAEMHSGFLAIRDELPQNLRARTPLTASDYSATCAEQIARIDESWSDCRARFGDGGPWLFGAFSIADVMYAPVALRFVTYEIALSDAARAFVDGVVALPEIVAWCAAAAAEPEHIDAVDARISQNDPDSPLVLG